MPAPAEPDLEAPLGEPAGVGDLAVEPPHEVVDDLGAGTLPEHRRTAQAARGDVLELLVGDLSQAALELLARLAQQVFRSVLAEEALEDRVDRLASCERVELDNLLGVLDRLHSQEPLQEEAVGAGRVGLEDGRAERGARGEPRCDRFDRFGVGEDAVERSQPALAPARASQCVGAERRRGEAVEQRGSECGALLEDGDVALGERERAAGIVRSDAAGEEAPVEARVELARSGRLGAVPRRASRRQDGRTTRGAARGRPLPRPGGWRAAGARGRR